MREINKSDGIFLHLVVFAWVFVISLTILNIIGVVPYYIDGTPSNEVLQAARERDAKLAAEQVARDKEEQDKIINERPILPVRLEIPSLGKDLPVSNPNTTDIDALDRELLTSVVRYPGSGTLGKDGNMLIFGHSTGYKTVNNKMYKAFNGIKNLEEGSVIKLMSGGVEYVYAVSNINHENASNVTIEFGTKPGVKQLTLTTCDSFGAKEDRYIVTADFVGSYKVSDTE
jgi:LPXTG-site transpeptidase (sortase) family protein